MNRTGLNFYHDCSLANWVVAANAVWLQLHALAYNLANFMRTLALPEAVKQLVADEPAGKTREDRQTGHLWNGSRAQHAGSVPDAALRLPDTPAECYRSRRSLVIWGMSDE